MNNLGIMNLEPFFKNGYQVVKDVVPQQLITKTLNYLENERDKTLEVLKSNLAFDNQEDLILKAQEFYNDKKKFSDLSNEAKMALSGHFRLEARLDETTREIPAHPKVQNVLKAALKAESIKLHMPPTARFILPMNTIAAVPPHQDVAYNKHVSNFIIMWVPFVNINAKCGGVVVHHGTGHFPELPTESGQVWLKGINSGSSDLRHCEMFAGDILLMNKFVVHESKGNTSKTTRYSIDYRLFDANLKSKKHCYDFDSKNIIEPEEITNN